MKPVKYRPLLRFYPFLVVTRERLWLADDHILLTRFLGFTEEYRRIYFATLQAVRIRLTGFRLAWNIVWLSLALLFGLPLLFLTGESSWRPLALIAAALFLLAAFLNTIMGQTCKVSFFTLAGEHKISCIKRVGRARKVLKRIRPHLMLLRFNAADEPPKEAALGTAASENVHVQ